MNKSDADAPLARSSPPLRSLCGTSPDPPSPIVSRRTSRCLSGTASKDPSLAPGVWMTGHAAARGAGRLHPVVRHAIKNSVPTRSFSVCFREARISSGTVSTAILTPTSGCGCKVSSTFNAWPLPLDCHFTRAKACAVYTPEDDLLPQHAPYTRSPALERRMTCAVQHDKVQQTR